MPLRGMEDRRGISPLPTRRGRRGINPLPTGELMAGDESFTVREWLYGALSGDSALVALVGSGGIHAYELPQNNAYPCVLFSLQSGVDTNSLGARAMVNQLWLIKGINQGESVAPLGPILARIDALIDRASVTFNGVKIRVRGNQQAEYAEEDNGIRYNHSGRLYRVYVG